MSIRIAVLCGGPFALPTLQVLGTEGFLAGIAIGAGEPLVVSQMQAAAEQTSLAFHAFPTRKSMDFFREWLDALNPDYVFSIAFPFRIAEELLASRPGRFFNFHPGPLPQYRGASPIFEVLRAGERETAVCVHHIEAGFDTGNIVFSEPVPITPEDTFGGLAERLAIRASYAAHNLAQMLSYATRIPAFPQDEAEARYFPKPGPDDFAIRWEAMTAPQIISLMKACIPWKTGVSTRFQGETVKIVHAIAVEKAHQALPGTILETDEAGWMHIACRDNGQLQVAALADETAILPVRSFIERGLKAGQRFG